MSQDQKIKIGISTCLLGERVRFDGGHKHDKYITTSLGQFFEWIAICPEVELGLGTPRPTLRFEMVGQQPRLMQPQTSLDITDAMAKYAEKKVTKLQKQEIYGYILKSRSPSCGLERIKVYRGHAIRPFTNGVGLYAQHLIKALPNLPIEDDGRLSDPVLRENWISRVFAYYAFHNEVFPRPSVGKLVKFHTKYKFTILSHCTTSYRAMGQLVATAKTAPIAEVCQEYETAFMTALKKRATAVKQVNVMEHMLGFFKKNLEPEVRKEILASIQDYRAGFVPLIVPITLIRHYAQIQGIEYLMGQSYLSPHPKQLALLSHI
jgi:uncharacterized protein YbgA (DUF1722 family)/uncharacterized protein YbbK (DUF523 family)